MAVRAFGTEERVPGSLPGGEERNTGSIFGQQERTTELLPERNDIVMCSCCVNEERTRKIGVLIETGNVANCGGSCLWEDPGNHSLEEKERNARPCYVQEERTTAPPLRYFKRSRIHILKTEERTRKTLSRRRKT